MKKHDWKHINFKKKNSQSSPKVVTCRVMWPVPRWPSSPRNPFFLSAPMHTDSLAAFISYLSHQQQQEVQLKYLLQNTKCFAHLSSSIFKSHLHFVEISVMSLLRCVKTVMETQLLAANSAEATKQSHTYYKNTRTHTSHMHGWWLKGQKSERSVQLVRAR